MEHAIAYHTVSRETFSNIEELYAANNDLFENYIDHLLWWNQRLNLVSRNVSRETIAEHIRHSLFLTQFKSYKKADFIVDAGTGGGLPGIPLAIASPQKSFILNDIVTKKAVAVKQICQKLGLKNIQTEDKSIAEIKIEQPFLLISKHAFKINELYKLTSDKPWTSLVFYKGLSFEQELDGIKVPLSVSVHDLSAENKGGFYEDKALIFVSRTN